MMRQPRRLIVAAVFVLGLVSSSVASASPGENVRAKPCFNGGWMTLTTFTGGTFKNQGQCVSYVVNGGVFGQPSTGGGGGE
jgi:hypothetical protein